MADLARVIAAQARKIEELNRRARGRSREGVVVESDAANGLFRVDLGAGGRPFLTPWIPAEALSAGTLAIQAEPVVGQHVRVTSESGDLTDAVVALSSFDASTARPHDKGGELKVVVGGTVITGTADDLTLESNGGKIVISADGIAITGAVAITGSGVTHDGVNIGKTHRHTHGDPAGTTSNPS